MAADEKKVMTGVQITSVDRRHGDSPYRNFNLISDQEVIDAVHRSTNFMEIKAFLNVRPTLSKTKIKLRCKELGLDVSAYDTLHSKRMSDSLSKEEVQKIADSCYTYVEVAKQLGCSSGYAKEILAEMGIDFQTQIQKSRKVKKKRFEDTTSDEQLLTTDNIGTGYIYKITNKVNGKVYIGQTSGEVIHRWREHISTSFNEKSTQYEYPLYRAFRKYGIEHFSFEVICVCTVIELNQKEREYIEQYDSTKSNRGYNQTTGGESGRKFTPCQEQEIVAYYKECCNMMTTSAHFGISYSGTKDILIRNGVPKESLYLNMRKQWCKEVKQYDLNGELCHIFASLADVGKWMQERGFTKSKSPTSAAHAIRNKIIKGENECFGYIWDMDISGQRYKKQKSINSDYVLSDDERDKILMLLQEYHSYTFASYETHIPIDAIKNDSYIRTFKIRGIEWSKTTCHLVGTDLYFRTATDAGHWLSEMKTGMEYTDITRRGRAIKSAIEHQRPIFGYMFEYVEEKDFFNIIKQYEVISYVIQENRSVPPQISKDDIEK